MHYHVMHYMPGCLPDGDMLTADTIVDARETLATEIETVIDDMYEHANDDATTANTAMVEIIRNDTDGDVTYALQHGSGYHVFDVDGYTYAVEPCDLADCDTGE